MLLHASSDALKIGINLKVIDKAVQMYNKGPVIKSFEEARTLRFITPCKMSGVVEQVYKEKDKYIRTRT